MYLVLILQFFSDVFFLDVGVIVNLSVWSATVAVGLVGTVVWSSTVEMCVVSAASRIVYVILDWSSGALKQFLNPVLLNKIMLKHSGKAEFWHRNNTVSTVLIFNADIDVEYTNVQVCNIPPEVDNGYLREVLAKFGDIRQIRNEWRSSQHRLQYYSGVRSVDMHIK